MSNDLKKIGNSIDMEVKGLKRAVCGKKNCNNLAKNAVKSINKMV